LSALRRFLSLAPNGACDVTKLYSWGWVKVGTGSKLVTGVSNLCSPKRRQTFMITLNCYYTYAYLRENGTPYYIGKGKGNRAFNKGKGEIKVPPRDRILFLKKNLTEEEAFKHEVYMIAVLGRKDLGTGILRNITSGGEGSSGVRSFWITNGERNRRLAPGTKIPVGWERGRKEKGKKYGPYKEKWYAFKGEEEGMFVPGEQPEGWVLGRKKRKHTKKRPPVTEETRAKMREAWKKRPPVSEETKAKLREMSKNQGPMSEETRAKMREIARNRPPVSKETRAKMSAAKTAYWARRGR